MTEIAREELGFQRTVCSCTACSLHCLHRPGCLVPADLARLCPPSQDLFAWAEQHLRARTGRRYPLLVPATRERGACHWYLDGKCLVHTHAPFGCAFFDSHQSQEEADRRYAAVVEAVCADVAAGGVYTRVWEHLSRQGLVTVGG